MFCLVSLDCRLRLLENFSWVIFFFFLPPASRTFLMPRRDFFVPYLSPSHVQYYLNSQNFLKHSGFNFFRWKSWKPKFEKENRQNSLNTIQLFVFYKPACLQKDFDGRALSIRAFSADGHYIWADSVSPPMNTIASRERFKPIRIGENLAVNYNDW